MNHTYHFKFTHAHTNTMKHEHVFTQTDQSPKLEGSRTISKLFPQDRNIKLGWKALCTLLCTIALILECINVTLTERCNHQNNQTTVSLLKTILKLLPVHSETIKGLYFTSREFISFIGALPFVRHGVLRQMEI